MKEYVKNQEMKNKTVEKEESCEQGEISRENEQDSVAKNEYVFN